MLHNDHLGLRLNKYDQSPTLSQVLINCMNGRYATIELKSYTDSKVTTAVYLGTCLRQYGTKTTLFPEMMVFWFVLMIKPHVGVPFLVFPHFRNCNMKLNPAAKRSLDLKFNIRKT